MNKYGAKKTNLDGHSFSSQLEASVYCLLEARRKAGELFSIEVQKSVRFTCGEQSKRYVVDFYCVRNDGSGLYVEAKGMEQLDWGWKKLVWAMDGPGPLEIWQGSAAKPKLTEIIIPENLHDI